jgi:hypothetical protein
LHQMIYELSMYSNGITDALLLIVVVGIDINFDRKKIIPPASRGDFPHSPRIPSRDSIWIGLSHDDRRPSP